MGVYQEGKNIPIIQLGKLKHRHSRGQFLKVLRNTVPLMPHGVWSAQNRILGLSTPGLEGVFKHVSGDMFQQQHFQIGDHSSQVMVSPRKESRVSHDQ